MCTGSSNALSTNCFRGATKNSSFHINSGCTTYPRNIPSLDVGSNLSPSLTRFFLGPFPKCTWHPKGLVERSLLRGTSCLHRQFSVEQPPLFHQPFPRTAGVEALAAPDRFRATLSRLVSRRSRSRCLRTADTRKSYFLFSVPSSAL